LWGPGYLSRRILKRMGREMPLRRGCSPEALTTPGDDDIRLARLVVQDDGRVASIEEKWRGIADGVPDDLASILAGGAQKSFRRRRHELASGRLDPKGYPARVLYWEFEMHELALQLVLGRFVSEEVERGAWTAADDDSLATNVLPNWKQYIAYERARCPRPNYETPATRTEGRLKGAVTRLGNEDPRYPGWYRIGYRERQEGRHDRWSRKAPERGAVVFSGALREGWSVVRSVFDEGAFEDWLKYIEPSGRVTGRRLASLVVASCWLGKNTMLAPTSTLRQTLGLSDGATSARLTLPPSAPEQIAFRSWRVRDPRSSDADRAWFIGCDVLMHPDLMLRLELLGDEIAQYDDVIALELPSDSNDDD
jgi:hypothetical protein